MSNSDFTDPGSSTYASNTLHVGDGTWDTGRDTFLLPNLMGVNFDTMRYNGMGNRFKDMPQYHTLIVAHGVIGTIVFLFIVPFSLLVIRYFSRWSPFWAFKLHAWCQVLTLFLSTVVFVLGWFAVGPKRSLSNPHHGIGLAIYVMVIFQVLWGYFVHKVESKRQRYHVPMKLVFHRWLGRALALLGLIQIPLGLTLYGSPKVLFILFSLAAFALLVAFFWLSYLYDTEGYHMGGSEYDSRHSYVSGPSHPDDGPHHRWGRMAAAGAAGAGLAALFRRRSKKDHDYDDSHESFTEDKYSSESSRGGWKDTFLKLGAVGGGALLLKKLFDRKRDRDSDTESGRYSRAHTRSDSMTEATMSRMEDGRRPEPSYPPLNRPPSRPPSRPQSPGSSYYASTYLSGNQPGPSHGARNTFMGAGALAAVKNLFSRRKKDDNRMEEMRQQEMEDERLARANSKRRFTGDGFYPRKRREESYTATDMSSDVTPTPRPPRGPSHGESGFSAHPVASGAVDGPADDLPPPRPPAHASVSDLPPPRPPHNETVSDLPPPDPSRHDVSDFASGAAAGTALGAGSSNRRRRSSSRHRDDHVESPPVSLKVKMHDDGRRVTLRRLTEEEAAAGREARRRERRQSRRRAGSASSLSGDEGRSYDRWRRVEELERQQQEQMQREQQEAAAAAPYQHQPPPPSTTMPPPSFVPPSNTNMSHMGPPPPPHVPSSLPYGATSITSPGTWTGTEASGSYANNRRRRRAERARARQERQGHSVEFT